MDERAVQSELFQVSVDLQDEKTRQQELDALIEAAIELNKQKAYIITKETRETVQVRSLTIQIIPYWQWAIELGAM